MLICIATTTALQDVTDDQAIVQNKIFICALRARGAGQLHYKCTSTKSYFI